MIKNLLFSIGLITATTSCVTTTREVIPKFERTGNSVVQRDLIEIGTLKGYDKSTTNEVSVPGQFALTFRAKSQYQLDIKQGEQNVASLITQVGKNGPKIIRLEKGQMKVKVSHLGDDVSTLNIEDIVLTRIKE